jgi:DNA-binding response OmpR family regulator
LDRTLRRGLIGVVDPAEAGRFAQALATHRFAPTLAFSGADVLTDLDEDSFAILMLDTDLVHEGTNAFLRGVRDRTDGLMVVLGKAEHTAMDPFEFQPAIHMSNWSRPDLVVRWAVEFLPRPNGSGEAIEFGAIRLDPMTRGAWVGDRPISLTRIEFLMLSALGRAQGAIVDFRDLAREVWRTGFLGDHAQMHAHAARIRRKIETDPSHPKLLVSVRGEGFRLAAEN